MRKSGLINGILVTALSIAVAVGGFSAYTLSAQAAHDVKATVSGTVLSGSDSSTLNLKTAQGNMVIKIDSETSLDTKIMTPGTVLYVDVYYGSDAYMHADRISSEKKAAGDSKTYTVSGNIADKEMSDNILYVDMGKDQMQLKVDQSTDYSGCGMLYAGKSITAVVYRGDDAYMHAASISDGTGTDKTTAVSAETTSSASQTAAVSTTTQVQKSVTAVTGTVKSDTKSGMLYLETKDGSYSLKLDSNTDYSGGYMLIAGKKITANIYRGDDAYMHVASVARTGSLSQTSQGSGSSSFTGTVTGDSGDGMLYLKTSGGVMSIKLDSSTSCSTPVFKGSAVTVTGTSCADGYWHASSIADK